MKNQKWDDYIVESLKDPIAIQNYLEATLEEFDKDGDKNALLYALRNICKAQGSLSDLAKETGLNRQGIYKILSEKGNPSIKTFKSILNYLGYRISIEKI